MPDDKPITRLILGLVALSVLGASCAPAGVGPGATATGSDPNTAPPATIEYPVMGEAPELVGEVWLNAAAPLRLADLRGKVVLLEMWTFGCINCRNTLPAVIAWHERFASAGLVVIGNHYPEFAYEEDLENLRRAVGDLGITYPVVQDNAGTNFLAYESRYWPTLVLIDKAGRVRYRHIGEGAYDETERAIEALLSEDIE